MSLKDVQLTKRIAKGAFGSVSKGLYHGETCAVKTLFRVDLYGSNEWLSELTILKNYCSHPNIISYHGAAVVPAEENVEAAEGDAFSFEGGSQSDCSASEGDAEPVQLFNIYVLSSFAAHGDLRRFWTKSEHLRLDGPNRGGWPLVMKLLQGANNALMYLHDHHVIHRDVKTKNIVVNDRLESELCDFGMARFDINRFVDTAKASPIKALGLGVVGGDGTKSGGGMNGDPTLGSAHGLSPSPERRSALKRQLSVVGTSEFMAPEIIFQEPYDHRCDTYSLGVVMAELMCRRIPCDGGEANDQSSGEEESAEDLFAEYLMESGTAAVTSGKNKPANVRQTKSKQGPEPATPRTKQALFLSRSARSWFKFNEEELVACQGAPAGTLHSTRAAISFTMLALC